MQMKSAFQAFIKQPIVKKSIRPLSVLLLTAIIILISIQIMNSISYECKYRHTQSYDSIISILRLDREHGVFYNPNARTVAKSIYSYRSKLLFDSNMNNTYINVFGIKRPNVPYLADNLNDTSLYHLTTCDMQSFNKTLIFTYVFNNDLYTSIIASYDKVTNKFKYDKGDIKHIIIKKLLKFGDEETEDLRKSIQVKISKNIDSSKLAVSTVDVLVNTLVNMSEEQLYNLITGDLIK